MDLLPPAVRHALLRLLVWKMRWMTRYLGFVARPLVRWVASREVIACGLRPAGGGAVTVIYTPAPSISAPALRDGRYGLRRRHAAQPRWQEVPAAAIDDFSRGLVRQLELPAPRIGEVYAVFAEVGGRRLRSPSITVKERTVLAPELLEVELLPGGEAEFVWPAAAELDAMIYFLVVEDEGGRAQVGVYTRELRWRYPQLRRASLAVGEQHPPPLALGGLYTARLLLVDYDGWVSHLAVRTFCYQPAQS